MRFLFGEPQFIKVVDPDKTDARAYAVEDNHISLTNRLQQKRAARECAEWIRNKVEIKSIKQTSFLHGKMYHISKDNIEHALLGSSNFAVRGLGLGGEGNNVELNYEINDGRDKYLEIHFMRLSKSDDQVQLSRFDNDK